MDIVFNITNHNTYSGLSKEDHKLLHDIVNINKQNQITIMGALEDLNAKVAELQTTADELQVTVDQEQADIKALLETNAAVVTDLNQQIVTLKEQLANAVDPAALTAVIESLEATKAKIVTAKEDIGGTV